MTKNKLLHVVFVLFLIINFSCGRTQLTGIDDSGIPDSDINPITCENDSDCDDHNQCNGQETCDDGICIPGTQVRCDDNIDCTADSCNETTGQCVFLPDHERCEPQELCDPENGGCTRIPCTGSEECSDSFYCNGQEYCDDNVCVAGNPITCLDSIDCTEDFCDEDLDRCSAIPDDTMCNDGLICNGSEICDSQLGCIHQNPLNCNDSNECTIDQCREDVSCVHVPRDNDNDMFGDQNCGGSDCNDNDPTVYPGAREICNDNKDNDCNGDVDCNDGLCFSDPRCDIPCTGPEDCDDHNACNGIETCVNNRCESGTPVTCRDDISCTRDLCVQSTGQCTYTPDNNLCEPTEICDPENGGCIPMGCTSDPQCNDGNACNGIERCIQGVCQNGTPITCNDNVYCTVDACNPTNGNCLFTPDHNLCQPNEICDPINGCEVIECTSDPQCDDLNSCNGQERCIEGICRAGTPISCSDNINCTRDECNPTNGICSFIPDDSRCDLNQVCDPNYGGCRPTGCTSDTECDDGNACNGRERCNNGVCQSGTPITCNDMIECTIDTCNITTGICSFNPDHTLCPPNQMCDIVSGCITIPCTSDPQCDDRNACNGRERCLNGICASGTPITCTDYIECTIDECITSTGLCNFTPDNTRCSTNEICDPTAGGCRPSGRCTSDPQCNDGNACNGIERCVGGTCQPGTAVNCNDNINCTIDTCDATTGNCRYNPDNTRCEQGYVCDTQRGCIPQCIPSTEICTDRIDNDCDNYTDCSDTQDCSSNIACRNCVREICWDTIDNDCDNQADCFDSDCRYDPACQVCVTEDCDNNRDDDCDMLTDCYDTEDCESDPYCRNCTPEVCNNWEDDDCDQWYDCDDPDCANNPICGNDTCASAKEIGPGTDSEYGTTNGLRNDYVPELVGDCRGGAGADAVYTFVLTQRSRVTIDTIGSDYDTVIYVRSANCASGPQLNCNDDTYGLQSFLEFSTLDPGRYFIFVDAYSAYSWGYYVLNLYVGSPSSEICNNNRDDDGDRYADCNDSDCATYPTCRGEICNNWIDDDGDWYTDCDDSDCYGSPYCYEICDNWIDDDGDMMVDCLDTDCYGAPNCYEICDNWIDDDGDWYTDCDDPDCEWDEYCMCTPEPEMGPTACNDGIDNDCDNMYDCEDQEDCNVVSGIGECCNGYDDNSNMLVDEFVCRCDSTDDCSSTSYVCYTQTVGSCGPRCNVVGNWLCDIIAPGSTCNRRSGQCEWEDN